MKRWTIFAVAALMAATLTGCGGETAAKVKEKASAPASVVESEDASDEPSDDASAEPSDEPTDEATEQATAALGDLVTVGDWDVKVTKVVKNAGSVIKSANQFNDKAKGVYVLVTYEATYTGSERTADISSDLSWSFTTSDAQVHDQASVVTQADSAEWPTEARKGGTVRGQAVFDLKSTLITGGTLTVEGYDDDMDEIYADFAL